MTATSGHNAHVSTSSAPDAGRTAAASRPCPSPTVCRAQATPSSPCRWPVRCSSTSVPTPHASRCCCTSSSRSHRSPCWRRSSARWSIDSAPDRNGSASPASSSAPCAACCLASSLYQLSFYAYAIVLLIASRASGVVKQALVPRLADARPPRRDQRRPGADQLGRRRCRCGVGHSGAHHARGAMGAASRQRAVRRRGGGDDAAEARCRCLAHPAGTRRVRRTAPADGARRIDRVHRDPRCRRASSCSRWRSRCGRPANRRGSTASPSACTEPARSWATSSRRRCAVASASRRW